MVASTPRGPGRPLNLRRTRGTQIRRVPCTAAAPGACRAWPAWGSLIGTEHSNGRADRSVTPGPPGVRRRDVCFPCLAPSFPGVSMGLCHGGCHVGAVLKVDLTEHCTLEAGQGVPPLGTKRHEHCKRSSHRASNSSWASSALLVLCLGRVATREHRGALELDLAVYITGCGRMPRGGKPVRDVGVCPRKHGSLVPRSPPLRVAARLPRLLACGPLWRAARRVADSSGLGRGALGLATRLGGTCAAVEAAGNRIRQVAGHRGSPERSQSIGSLAGLCALWVHAQKFD
mmetsp:Transcript_62943/g.158889  ORF Transcript_62943/g.158889 Transcript_62943/m.158889 type:complete len:287 (+) Transcript_62943:1518-2378(+)